VASLLRALDDRKPRAAVIVAELVGLAPEVLAASRWQSVMPELLLFHELSGQGVLSWQQHQKWLAAVPYRVAKESRFDELESERGPIPSSIVWCLEPR